MTGGEVRRGAPPIPSPTPPWMSEPTVRATDQVVVTAAGEVVPGVVTRVPFVLTEVDVAAGAEVVVAPPARLDVALESPHGDRIDAADVGRFPALERVEEPGVTRYRWSLPVDDGASVRAHEGLWNVVLRVGRCRTDGRRPAPRPAEVPAPVGYSLVVRAQSLLQMQGSLTPSATGDGRGLRLRVLLAEDGQPLTAATVRAVVTAPDGSASTLPATSADAGTWTAHMPTDGPGAYRWEVVAEGVTASRNPFTRAQVPTTLVP